MTRNFESVETLDAGMRDSKTQEGDLQWMKGWCWWTWSVQQACDENVREVGRSCSEVELREMRGRKSSERVNLSEWLSNLFWTIGASWQFTLYIVSLWTFILWVLFECTHEMIESVSILLNKDWIESFEYSIDEFDQISKWDWNQWKE